MKIKDLKLKDTVFNFKYKTDCLRVMLNDSGRFIYCLSDICKAVNLDMDVDRVALALI